MELPSLERAVAYRSVSRAREEGAAGHPLNHYQLAIWVKSLPPGLAVALLLGLGLEALAAGQAPASPSARAPRQRQSASPSFFSLRPWLRHLFGHLESQNSILVSRHHHHVTRQKLRIHALSRERLLIAERKANFLAIVLPQHVNRISFRERP